MRLSPQKLEAARTAAGLTREAVAVTIGRSYHTITSYEMGRIDPPASIVGRLAGLYRVPVSDLYEDDVAPVAS